MTPPPIVGRRAELKALERLLHDALAGERAAVAVIGEPGIGKTRVLHALKGRADELGFRVLDGRAFELERDIPFGLVAETLDQPLSELDAKALGRLGDERLAELAAVLPSFAEAGRGLTTTLEVERYRSHHAVRAALEELAADQPLLLIFDDVHWGDPASLEVVSHLLRREVPGSLLALAYRPHQAPRMIIDAVAREAAETGLRVLELGPLSQREATKLMGGALSAAGFETLFAESGGNPFYLEQLARSAAGPSERSLSGTQAVGQAGVPIVVREAIAGELDALSPTGLELLQAAAVAGEPFDLDLAAKVAALDEPAAFAALDELVHAELLHETDVPGTLTFRHPIVRRAVYDATGSGWLLGAHRRAAQALADRGAAIGTRAYHVERSAEVGNQGAIDLLTKAGQVAAARAPAAAARWFEAALRLLPETADPRQRLALLLPLATALGNTGRLQECQQTLIRALALIPENDVTTRLTLTAGIARTEQGLGRGNEARRLLSAALAEADPDGAEAIRLMVELTTNHLMLRERDAAAAAAETAHSRALAFGDPALIASAAATGAVVGAWQGGEALEHARALADQAAAIHDDLDDHDFDAVSFEAFSTTAYAEAALLRWESANRRARRGLRISRALGYGALFVDLMNVITVAEMLSGHLAEARSAADTGVDAAMMVDNDQRLAGAEGFRCWTAWAQGQLDEALAAGKHAIEAAERVPYSFLAWAAQVHYGRVLRSAGERERGLAQILAAGGYELTEVPPSFRPFWHAMLAEMEIADGHLERAEELTRWVEESAATMDLSMRRGDARYARACMHRAGGDLDLAAAAAREAVGHYAEADTPLEATKARILLGRVYLESGDDDAALREFEGAHATAMQAGAAGLAHRAAEELRQIGAPKRGRTRRRGSLAHGPEALTAREREVAGLVAEGHTNREIAEQLFVSPKTVETHLSQVFTKLDVSSRVAVASAIRAGATSE
jgi:DNA-binding CsgD family transcriptional regulator